jgi:hypothetical protein
MNILPTAQNQSNWSSLQEITLGRKKEKSSTEPSEHQKK